MDAGWRIEAFGRLRASAPERAITRFRTQKTASLLGYLAVHLGRSQPREALLELLWPDSDIRSARLSLNTAISSLRRQLEPPGVPAGSVLQGDRIYITLNPEVVTTDVADFRRYIRHSRLSDADPADRIRSLSRAVEVCSGELLEGMFDEWILEERRWWADELQCAVEQLGALCFEAGDDAGALEAALRAIRSDPLREEGHELLIRIHARAGRLEAARRQYMELEKTLREELSALPRHTFEDLVREARSAPGRPESRAAQGGVAKPEADANLHKTPTQEAEQNPVGFLPSQFTRFFGREDEIGGLSQLLADDTTRLVTITGVGGTGKTRLAIETGERLRHRFPGGVWFVPLAEVADPPSICRRLSETLRAPATPHAGPIEQIAERLEGRKTLVIFDNFEQLVEEGALVVESALARIPNLEALATSRRRLHVAGEREFPLRPLPTPEPGLVSGLGITEDPHALATLMTVPSVQLLVDRAQLARPDFQITPRNASVVAELCRGLEGIPLAIELAGARAQALTMAQILGRLGERLAMMDTRRANRAPRHRSLRAALDWSFDLLSPELRRFYALLSVFAGGWSVEAAGEVTGEARAAEYLAQLRAHSLVSVRESRGGFRYDMLETLREYAAERLEDGERAQARDRHAAWFLRLATASSGHLEAPEMPQWIELLGDDDGNLHAALEHLLEAMDGEPALRFAAAMWHYWQATAQVEAGRSWLGRILAMPGATGRTAFRAQALNGAGNLAYRQGDHAASLAFHEEALSIRRELRDRKGIAGSLGNMANVLTTVGRFADANERYAEAIATYRDLGLKPNEAVSLNNRGRNLFYSGDLTGGRASFQEALEIDRELGHRVWEAYDLSGLAIVDYLLGDPALSVEESQASLELFRQAGHVAGTALGEHSLGLAECALGRFGEAREAFRKSLRLHWQTGNRQGLAFLLEGLSELAMRENRAERAVTLMASADHIRATIGAPLPPCFEPMRNRVLASARKSIGRKAAESALRAGSKLGLRECVALALSD